MTTPLKAAIERVRDAVEHSPGFFVNRNDIRLLLSAADDLERLLAAVREMQRGGSLSDIAVIVEEIDANRAKEASRG